MTTLIIENLAIKSSTKKQAPILISINTAQLQPGLCVVVGPNGAGKTSLLRGLAELLPSSGNIQLNNHVINKQSRLWRAQNIAYLAQHNTLAWPITSQQAIDLGNLPHTSLFTVSPVTWAELLDLVHLLPKSMDYLSGGELARVHLARAMTTNAKLTLLDEPLAHLDIRHQHLALQALKSWCHQQRKIVILTLHQLDLAYQYADVLWLLDQRHLVWQGNPMPSKNDEIEVMRGHLNTAFSIEWSWILSKNRFIPLAYAQCTT
ncbi:MAG: ABC transporter ATP-binding protein [Pseudomonadota bacterium]